MMANVFDLNERVIRIWLLIYLFIVVAISPMCNTSAKNLVKKATFNNNLPNQANDVMVNPVNPDSNTQLLRA
jgi:hypothetical protein